MNKLTKRQKEQALVVLAVLFLITLGAYSYLQLYSPAKQANEHVVQVLTNERDILFALQRQEAQQSGEKTFSSRSLQQQVPVKPLEDQILLQVHEAEIKSDTFVDEVNFTLEESVIDNLPEGVEQVHALLTEVRLQADAYSKVDQFLEEIEGLKRIVVIESVEFVAPLEDRTVNEEAELMDLIVTFRAFFRPDLVDLQEETPKVDAPEPSTKKDPTPINPIQGMEDEK